MSESNTKPLLTFTICAYNQEQFIREAVEGAFVQTYSPLEIILSDDCSKDRTFEIMREMAEAYRGPHQVILNRNSTNLGLAGHSNRLAQLARGQLLVGAAGDDVCLPNRVEVVYQAWEHSGRRAMAIQSGFIAIDEQGVALDELSECNITVKIEFDEQKPALESYIHTLKPGIIGCALACNPNIFSTFGPLPKALIHEDNVIVLRALCLGPLLFINVPLVKRRFHGNNLYSRRHKQVAMWDEVGHQESRMIHDARNRVVLYEVFLSDLLVARKKKLIVDEQWNVLESACVYRRQLFLYQVEYANATMARKFRILFSVYRAYAGSPLIKWMLFRLMPTTLFRLLKVMGNSAKLALEKGFQADRNQRLLPD
jgi:glycosyltransferase involved in cell wall biosynthesis